jgi:hypothetical protein
MYRGEEAMTEEEAKENHTLFQIALVKAYIYCEEYNPYTGRTEPKHGANYLKEGYLDGFLAGFTYKLTGEE